MIFIKSLKARATRIFREILFYPFQLDIVSQFLFIQ